MLHPPDRRLESISSGQPAHTNAFFFTCYNSTLTYSPTRFPEASDPTNYRQPCVYVRCSPFHCPIYVAATAKDILRREHSRSRKFQQLLRSQHAYFEPAFRYWHHTNTYWLFTPPPIEIAVLGGQLRAAESTWQYTLRPQLNSP